MSNNVTKNIVELVNRASSKENAKKPWIYGSRTTSYGMLADRISRMTRLFGDAGLTPGKRVMLSTTNDHEMPVLYLALLRNGLTAVIVDPETKLGRFKTLVGIAKPDGYIVDAGKKSEWELDLENFVVQIDDIPKPSKSLFSKLLGRKKPDIEKAPEPATYPSMLDQLEPMSPPSHIDQKLDAYVLFTSGTTSVPKGVRISHHALFAHLATLSNQYDYDPNARILNVLKLHHTDGITQGPIIAAANSCTVYRPFEFDIQHLGELLDTIYTQRVTHFVVVPTIIALIERLGSDYQDAFKTDDFKFLICAADLLDPALWTSFEKRFGVVVANIYGLTETVTGGIFCGPTDKDRKIGTVGKPSDCQVKIVDDNQSEVGVDRIGELLIKGDMVMDGYLNAPEATEEVLKNGWFSTGDLFSVDPEGFYHFRGRKKLLIITGGINVHPEEVTETLRCSEDVAEAFTYGEADSTFGEIVVSCVVPSEDSQVSEQQLIEYCRANLEAEKIPSKIYILDSLPKTAAGKTVLAEVRQKVTAQKEQNKDIKSGSISDVVISIAAESFSVSPDSLSSRSSNVNVPGWDSLAHLEFITVLEQHFDTSFSTAEIMRVDCLNDAVQIIEEKKSQ